MPEKKKYPSFSDGTDGDTSGRDRSKKYLKEKKEKKEKAETKHVKSMTSDMPERSRENGPIKVKGGLPAHIRARRYNIDNAGNY